MPCTPHPHMPSSLFFCLALWLLLQSRSRWRVRPSFSFCSNVPRESEPFPWLLLLLLSPMNFRNHTFQLSIGMSMCSCWQFTLLYSLFLTLYLFSVHAWCSEICNTSSPEWIGGWSSVKVLHNLSIILKNGWGTRRVKANNSPGPHTQTH